MYQIYDLGKGLDRFTCVYGKPFRKYGKRFWYMIGFSERPTHPQGFYQHAEGQRGRHLGKKIELCDLPEEARKALEWELKEIGELISEKEAKGK